MEDPRAGLLQGRHRHHGVGRSLGQEASRSRTTARSTPRTTPTCPRRSPSACCRCCSTTGRPRAQGRAHRLRLRRHGRRDHPVPHRAAWRSSSSSPPSLPGRRTSSINVQPPPDRKPQGQRHRGRRSQLPDPAPRSVRRHRQPALEPVDHRRLQPVHARVLPVASSAPGRRRHLLPVGAALRDGALEHQDHLPHAARGIPLRIRLRRRGPLLGHHPDRQPQTPLRSTSDKIAQRLRRSR